MSLLLDIQGVRSGYGAGDVLKDIDLGLAEGEIVGLLGRNGVGKTTLMNTIVGLVRPRAGSVKLDGRELAGAPAHQIARAGIAIVPQGRRISLRSPWRKTSGSPSRRPAVEACAGASTTSTAASTFDERQHNRGDQLSGGEQQMLAIGRALLASPRVLLVDEPSEGLAGLIVDRVTETIGDGKERGLSAILVEQNLHVAVALSDHVAIMDRGEIVYRAATADFRRDRATAQALLGVA